jgi:F-type H+-transporting ATPase subunit epsilon
MHCQLRSADRTFFDGNASMVVAESPRGEFAIMDGHAPLLAVLDRGPIRIHTGGETRIFACRGGTLRTTGDRVTLLVQSGVPLEEIDPSELEAKLTRLEETDGAANVEEKEYLSFLRAVKERYG